MRSSSGAPRERERRLWCAARGRRGCSLLVLLATVLSRPTGAAAAGRSSAPAVWPARRGSRSPRRCAPRPRVPARRDGVRRGSRLRAARESRRPGRRSSGVGVVLGELLRSGPARALAGSTLGFAFAHRAGRASTSRPARSFGGVYLATGALAAASPRTGPTTAAPLVSGRAARRPRGVAVSFAELDDVTKRFGSTQSAHEACPSGSTKARSSRCSARTGPANRLRSPCSLGLRRPDAGVARLFGADPARPRSRRSARRRRRRRRRSRRRSACARSSSSSGPTTRARCGRGSERAVRARAGSLRARPAASPAASGGDSESRSPSWAIRGSPCSTSRPRGSTSRRARPSGRRFERTAETAAPCS